jgi:hypothetical protein
MEQQPEKKPTTVARMNPVADDRALAFIPICQRTRERSDPVDAGVPRAPQHWLGPGTPSTPLE